MYKPRKHLSKAQIAGFLSMLFTVLRIESLLPYVFLRISLLPFFVNTYREYVFKKIAIIRAFREIPWIILKLFALPLGLL